MVTRRTTALKFLAAASHHLQSVRRMIDQAVGGSTLAPVVSSRKGRRLLSIQDMRSQERSGVKQTDIARQAGISERQVRSLLSRVRTRPPGRPSGP